MSSNGNVLTNGKAAKKRRRRIVVAAIAGLLLIGGGYGGYAALRPNHEIDPSKLAPVERGDLARVVVATGTVKWFNPTKGYGFIQPQGGGKDVFVHISAVERAGLSTLNEGQQIEYEIVANRGKESAENLKVR